MSFVAIVPADEDSEELDLEKKPSMFSALRRFVRLRRAKLVENDGMSTLVRSGPVRGGEGGPEATWVTTDIAIPLDAEAPDDCPDLLYQDDQPEQGLAKLREMLSDVRSDLQRFEKARGLLEGPEIVALRRFRIDQYEEAKKEYHLAEATELAGKLLGKGVGVVVTLGFYYVGGAMKMAKRILHDTAGRAVQNWAMQNPELAVRTAYKTARFVLPGNAGKVVAIGTCGAVAAKSGLDMIAAVDVAYRAVVAAAEELDDVSAQHEGAATACTAAVIIAMGDKKKAARAFLPRIKKMCGVKDDDTTCDKTFMGAATRGFKRAAAAETRQLMRNMKIGQKFGTGLADQLNKKMGLTRIREASERLADEQLYELRYMKQDHRDKSTFRVVGRSDPFHIRHSVSRPHEGDSGLIEVGPWEGGGPKRVKLPRKGLYVDPTPRNQQDPSWKDTFTCTVVGEILEVRRVDLQDGGWSQDLQFLYLSVTEEDLAMLDTDGDGIISLDEFLAADLDGDGILSVDEVRERAERVQRARAGKLKVGSWDGPGPKRLKLPRSGLRVDPVPINLPKGFSDRFKCTTFGDDLAVFRIDDGAVGKGWGHHFEFRWFDQNEFKGEIKVGKFEGPGWKELDLPAANLYVDPTPLNKQNDEWTDSFECQVVGSKLRVRRTDSLGAGWGQDVVLRYCLLTAEARAVLDTDGDGVLSADEVARANKAGAAAAARDQDREDAAARTIQGNVKAFLFRRKLPF